MRIKNAIQILYTKHLQRKWKMTSAGARFLSNSFLSDYKKFIKKRNSFSAIWNAHKMGFSYSDWVIMDLDNEKCRRYISNAQYYAKHPFNGQYSKWIDDKLTLKYLCAGTSLDRYMPKYYFMINDYGVVMRLMDCFDSIQSNDLDGILNVLKEKRVLALKRIAGAIGEGFYKLEYDNGCYKINGLVKKEEEIKIQLAKLCNYLIIEYLFPHEQFAEYCPNTCNCLRYLVARIDGKLKMIKSYIRLGAVQSGFIENYNAGGVLCYVDSNGFFNGGNIMNMEKGTNIQISEHPDTKKELKGRIPQWDEILDMVLQLDRLFPQLDYLGIDVVVTSDHQIKMLEINSLTSLDGLQLLSPITDKKEIAFLARI